MSKKIANVAGAASGSKKAAKKTNDKKQTAKASAAKRSAAKATKSAKSTAGSIVQAVKNRSADGGLDEALNGAIQRSAARNYEAATEKMQSLKALSSNPSYTELSNYNSVMRDYQRAFENAINTGVIETQSREARVRLKYRNMELKRHLDGNDELLKLGEKGYNEQVYYPGKYRNLRSGGDTSRTLSELGKALGAQRSRKGDASALQAEYDWLKEHQYDYWSQNELKQGIQSADDRLKQAGSDLKTYSGYSYRYHNNDWEQRSNKAEKQRRAAQTQLDRMRAAKESNAYRDAMMGWSEADLKAMEDLARYSGRKQDVRNAGNAAQTMTPGANNPFLALKTSQEANANDARMQKLVQRFRDKGYTDEQIASLTDYFLRNQHMVQRQQEMQDLADWTGKNIGTYALGSAISVPANLASGLGYIDVALQNAAAGTDAITGDRKRIDQYSALTGLSDVSTTIRGTVGQGINEKLGGGFWGGAGNFLYQTGMSMADFLAAAPAGHATTAVLGGAAAMQATRDAYARGATDQQALAVGGLAGVAEAFFEHFSLGRLRALRESPQVAKRTFKQILLETAKQAGVEGSEEVATTVANTLSDQLIMGDKSALNIAISKYMTEDGMTEEQATKKAMLEWLGSTALDFAGGALSGGIIGGGASLINNASIDYSNRQTGSRIREAGNMQALIDQGMAAPEGSAAYLAAQRAQSANDGSNRQARYAGEVYQAMRQADLHDAVQARLEQLGAQDAQATADAVIAKLQQQNLNRQQQKLADTKQATRVLNELQDAQNGIEGSNDWARGMMLQGLARDVQLFQPNDVEEDEDSGAKAFAEQYGKQAEAVETVRKMQPELDAETFQAQFENAHMLGREGAAMETVNNTTATSKLTQEQRETAWQMGRAAAEADIDIMEGENENGGEVRIREGSERNDSARAAKPVRGMAEGAEPTKGYPAAVARSAKDEGADSVKFRSEAVSTQQLGVREGTSRKGLYIPEESSYTPAMKEAVRVAEEHGRKIVLFGGGNLEVREGGYVVDARGMYDEATNTMYVRADHPDFTADQIARHENGHGMIADGSVDAKELQKQIAASMTEAELRQAVSDYVDLYDGTGLKEEQIIHEMICDALGNMNVFAEIDVFKEQAQRAERTMPAIRSAVQEQQKGRAPPEGKTPGESEAFSRELSDYEVYNDRALISEDTLDKWLSGGYFGSSNPNYAQAYAAYMSPKDFITLTTSDAAQRNRIYDRAAESKTVENTVEQSKRQPIQLMIDHETGEVNGHEGRHRMVALQRAGVTQVPVLLFDSSNKYSKTHMDRLTLTGQFDSMASVDVRDLEPLSQGNRQTLVEKFATPTRREQQYEKYGNAKTVSFSRDLSALDSDYMTAVESGDMETAQRMVDEAAKKAGYTIRGYHGTAKHFTVFDKRKINSTFGVNGGDLGFYFTPYESDADEYASYAAMVNGEPRGLVLTSFLKMENPLIVEDDGWGSAVRQADIRNGDLKRWASQGNHDGIIVRSTDEIMEDGLPDSVFIVFEPEQIKSADPVTYDDNGNIIPLSERFNPEQPDIRFSRDIESLSELRQENRELRERLERAKAQTRRTKEAAPREADVRKAARGVIKSAESKADLAEVTADMQALASYMMNGEGKGKQREAASWTAVKERAVEIARDIVDNAKVLREGSDPELYKNMRQYVRGTKMTLAAEDRADMQDGYGEFVKRNRGTLRLGNDGVPVETAYQELQDEFGKGFFPDEITHPADQLQRIADVVNGLKPIYEAPSGRYYDEAVEWTANAIVDELLGEDVRQEAPTYADRAEARRAADVARERDRADARVAAEREKAEKRRKAYMERSNAALKRVREQRDRKIAEIKQHNRDVNERRKERSARTALWHKILDLKKDFRQMVERPQQADSKHAPMRLARALDGVTSCFNVEDRQRVLPVSELDRALGKLRDVYKLAEKDDELAMYYDAGLIESIDNVRTMLNDVDPFDPTLDSKKLQNVYDLLRMCKHNVTTANKFATRNWAKTIIEAGRKWASEIASASVIFKKGFGGQLLNYQLRPDSMFARFSGFAKNSVGEQVQEMFVDGTEKMLRIQQDFYYHFERFSTSKEFDRLTRRGKGSLVDVGLKDENGNTIKLTRDQMLALYMNLRSEDNLLAVAYGGVDVPSNSAYYTGKVAKSFDDSVRSMSIDANVFRLIEEARNLADEAQGEITEERRQEIDERLDELQNEVKAMEQEAFSNLFGIKAKIEKQLTKFEKELVETADKWMKRSKDYINAETKAMYGIEKAQVEHYWPIHRNMNFVNTDMRTATNEINLENWGSLKERVKSHAPVKLTGFIFELDNHTQKMSQFCGFAAAQRDFNKLYQTRMPYQHSTLKEQISKKFGSDSGVIGVSGMEYIDNYIAAVSGATNKEKPSLFALARRNLPRATLSANFRVALSQVASVPTAAAEVGWGAMAKGFARYSFKGFSAKQIEALAKADPWFWQRSRGDGGMREFAESKDSTFALDRAYNKVAGTKVGKALLNWCQKFDMYATFTQWAMAEEWVKSNRKDLKQGTDAFNEAVSHKYRDILRKTQPNYTVTERSDLLRDNREAMKWATMYKTQSSQNLNILYDATARLRQYTRDFKNGNNGVTQEDLTEARRQFARAYTGVILGGTVTFVLFRAFANALMHAMNPYRDDDDEMHTEGVIKGLISETLGAMAGMFLLGSEIEEFIYAAVTGGKYWGLSDSAISSVSDVLSDAYKITQDPSRDNILRLVNSLSAPLGLPVDNVKRIVNGIRYHIEDIQNGEFLSFEAGVDRTTAQQLNRFIGAYRNDDSKKMQRVYDEMVRNGKAKDPEASAQSAIRKRLKSAYLGDEEGVTISDKQALRLLMRYGGKSKDDAKDLLNEWKFEKAYGFKYDDLKDAYLDGKITEKDYVSARVTYGGKSEEDAKKDAQKLRCQIDYGVEYGEQSIIDAAIGGDITVDEAKSIWMEYGGVSEKEATSRADHLQFVLDHPGTAYEDVSSKAVEGYNNYGMPANIPAEDFMEYFTDMDSFMADYDENGNLVKDSKKQKVVNYINALNISNEQKTAMYLAYGYSAKKVPAWT